MRTDPFFDGRGLKSGKWGRREWDEEELTVPLFQRDYPQAFQLPEQFFDVCEGFFVRHIVDFSKASGQFFVCRGGLFLQQSNEVC